MQFTFICSNNKMTQFWTGNFRAKDTSWLSMSMAQSSQWTCLCLTLEKRTVWSSLQPLPIRNSFQGKLMRKYHFQLLSTFLTRQTNNFCKWNHFVTLRQRHIVRWDQSHRWTINNGNEHGADNNRWSCYRNNRHVTNCCIDSCFNLCLIKKVLEDFILKISSRINKGCLRNMSIKTTCFNASWSAKFLWLHKRYKLTKYFAKN